LIWRGSNYRNIERILKNKALDGATSKGEDFVSRRASFPPPLLMLSFFFPLVPVSSQIPFQRGRSGRYISARSKKSSRREFLSKCKRFRSLFRAVALRFSKGTTWIYFDNRDTLRNVQWCLVRYWKKSMKVPFGKSFSFFRKCDIL